MPEPILAGSEILKGPSAPPLTDKALAQIHTDIIYAANIASYLRYNRTAEPEALLAQRGHLKALLKSLAETL